METLIIAGKTSNQDYKDLVRDLILDELYRIEGDEYEDVEVYDVLDRILETWNTPYDVPLNITQAEKIFSEFSQEILELLQEYVSECGDYPYIYDERYYVHSLVITMLYWELHEVLGMALSSVLDDDIHYQTVAIEGTVYEQLCLAVTEICSKSLF